MQSKEPLDETHFRFEDFTIDVQRRGLYRGAERIHLTSTPFRVLEFLARNAGRIVSKDKLLEVVWGGKREENTVEQAVRQIRRALGEEKEQPRFIQTVPGEGYCFIAAVEPKNGDSLAQEAKAKESLVSARHSSDNPSRFSRRAALISVLSVGVLLIAFAELRRSPSTLAVANPTKITTSQNHILSPLLSYGAQIFYLRYENGHYSVAAVPDKGGESAEVSAGLQNPELCDLSPVTGAMLLRDLVRPRDNNNPVYVKPLNGAPQRVGSLLAYEAAWYPDGKRILVSFNGVVYATDAKGESLRRLFSVPGNAFWIRWRPDGKRLRFTVIDTASEATSLWEANADGTALHKLFPNVNNQLCCGSWTPDGGFYLLQARVGNTFQIWAERNRDGSLLPIHDRPFPLISGAPSYRSPLSSQDGGRLFVRAEAPRGELVKYEAHIGEFISILPSISARTIAFSRDANWFAYTSVADNNLWRCRADGTDCLELTQGFKQTVLPSWSPDGRTIAFMGTHFTGGWGLYSVPANGGTVRPLVQANEAMGYPDWSPDGRQLVFSEVPPASNAKGIYIMAFPSLKISTISGSKDFSYPRWSPDGRFLVAQHSGDLNLYLFDFTSGKWRLLAGMAANYPEWSRDSRYVYFLSERSASRAIFRVSMASLGIEKVASLNGVERPPFFMGDWIGMAPDGSPIAIRNATIEDIYAWNLIAR